MLGDQLRYTCTRCGNCCRWKGYVRLEPDEVERIAAFLRLAVEEFTERYTLLTRDRRGLSLIENDQGFCIFLTEPGECMIQPVKPEQCRQFPNFWNFPGFRQQCECIDNWEDDCVADDDGGRSADTPVGDGENGLKTSLTDGEQGVLNDAEID